VYYTPEWVVNRIVDGVIGQWCAAAKKACGWPSDAPANMQQLNDYQAQVEALTVVDPACGSGAFLIGAFRRLLRERMEIEALRTEFLPGERRASEATLTAKILDRNIHGVDISGAAVEIAKLALWLHSARADAPLSSLDDALKCGNSLVGLDFYRGEQRDGFTERHREQVNAFDWAEAFPFGGEDPGRFDIVVGNPPYVKLQNLRKVDPDVADYLLSARGYESARTGNFDLYLPFIEKGLRLLRPGGRMGYIAPSLWATNEYGEGLRRLVRRGRNLQRWVDFKSHQIFDEAITYTALQFFTAEPNLAVEVISAPHGADDVAEAAAGRPIATLPYERLPPGDPWLLATGEERALIDRLAETCLRLDDPSLTTHIFQGLITSADSVYHLTRLSAGRYLCTPKDGDPAQGIPHTPP
jgi:SAM-dependent methyltransferase